jgi:hypothetical protein
LAAVNTVSAACDHSMMENALIDPDSVFCD